MKKYNNYFIDTFLLEKQVNQWIRKTTIKTYYTLFNYLLNSSYIDFDNPSTFTEWNFKRFLWELLIQNEWSSHTYNRNKRNAKVFCDYLVHEWFLFENPLKKIPLRKVDRVLPKIYTQTQIDLIMYTLTHYYSWSDFLSMRNRTLMFMYMYTGLRFSELVNLTMSDVNMEEGYIRVNNGKGGKDRYVPLVNKLYVYLNLYIEERYKHDFKKTVLFPTQYGNNLQYREVYKINKILEGKLGFKVCTHMFRHTFATELVKKNLNLYNISQILWHTKLDTTKVYLNFDTEKVKDAINLLNLYA